MDGIKFLKVFNIFDVSNNWLFVALSKILFCACTFSLNEFNNCSNISILNKYLEIIKWTTIESINTIVPAKIGSYLLLALSLNTFLL